MRLTSANIALVIGFAAVGCGAQTRPPKLSVERHAIWCPSNGIFPASGRTVREAGSFDVRTLLGERESRARRIIAAHGCRMRVLDPGGHRAVITADARPDRVDLEITRGIVTEARVY